MKLLYFILLALSLASPAWATCNPVNSPIGSPGCLPDIGTPQSGDTFMDWRPSLFPDSLGTVTLQNLATEINNLLSPLPTSGGTMTGALGITALSQPSTPGSGVSLWADSNGAVHVMSPFYDSLLVGAKYEGDASRPWFTSPIGIGVDSTSTATVLPPVRIARSDTYTGAQTGNPSALSVAYTMNSGVTTLGTAGTFTATCNQTNSAANVCTSLATLATKPNANLGGNPFGLNSVAKNTSGRESSVSGAIVGAEMDAGGAGPDDAGTRIVLDNIAHEYGGPSTDGATTFLAIERARPSDSKGQTTGPVVVTNAHLATFSSSYPGARIINAYGSDGADFGLGLTAANTTATTNASSSPGTNTITVPTTGTGSPSFSGVGALVCENSGCGSPSAIPAGTTISSVANSGGTTTITLSANLAGPGIANAQTLFIYTQYIDPLFFSGYASDAIANLTRTAAAGIVKLGSTLNSGTVGEVSLYGQDSTNTVTDYGDIVGAVQTNTHGSAVGQIGLVPAGSGSFYVGSGHTAGGTATLAAGQADTTSGQYTTALGKNANDFGLYGIVCHSSQQITSSGDEEECFQTLGVQTTSATTATMTADRLAASSVNTLNFPSGFGATLDILITGQDATAQTHYFSCHILVANLSRPSGTETYNGPTACNATNSPQVADATGASTVILVGADNTHKGLSLQVTAPNTDTWDWSAAIRALVAR